VNPDADRASFASGDDGARGLTAWILEPRKLRPRRAAIAHHHGQVCAVSFSDDAPLLAGGLTDLLEELRGRLLRVKGFVHLAGEARRGFLELAGDRAGLTLGEPWGSDRPRTELVLIGEDIDEASIRRRLWACRTAG
jgi:G3E family GTPase